MDEIILRKAEYSDLNLLYKWANDSKVRSNSFNSNLIQYEDHVKWFKNVMEDDSILQFIMMKGDEPIGQIRLMVDNNQAEIGYSIDEKYRGLGYGHKILQLIVEKIRIEYPYIKTLVAKVKPTNMASNKLFKSEGYEVNYLFYSLNVCVGGGYFSILDVNCRQVMPA